MLNYISYLPDNFDDRSDDHYSYLGDGQMVEDNKLLDTLVITEGAIPGIYQGRKVPLLRCRVPG